MSNKRYVLELSTENDIRSTAILRNISSAKYGGDWHSTPHTHHYAELFYIVGGMGQFQIEDQLYPVKADQMVIVNMKTGEYEGDLKPTIEVPLHAKLLLTRPEVNGIVHTHSSKALAVAVTRKGIPPICDDQVQILGGDVRCADYTFPGGPEMADAVEIAIKDRMGALIANHGAIAMGRNLKEALVGATILEKTAQIWIDVQSLGEPVMISDEDCAKFHDFFLHKYGQKK